MMSTLNNQGTFEGAYSFLEAFGCQVNLQGPHSSHFLPQTSPFTSHTSHLTPQTLISLLSPDTSHLTSHASFLTPHTSHLTPRSSNHTPRTSCFRPPNLLSETSDVAPHTSQPTFHASRLTPLILHINPHTSFVRQRVLFAWGDMVTMLPDSGKLQERLFAWEMARNKLTHVMFLIQHSYTVCAFYRRAMPSSPQHFRCCMFIAMLAGAKHEHRNLRGLRHSHFVSLQGDAQLTCASPIGLILGQI